MAQKHEYLKEGRSHSLLMERAGGAAAQKKAFEDAKDAYFKTIKLSLEEDGREYKEAWRALGRLYMARARQEREAKYADVLWNAAALALARFLFLDKRDNGTLDQDARMALENLERRACNKALFEEIIGKAPYPLRAYVEKHKRYPPLPDAYRGGTEDVPYGVV